MIPAVDRSAAAALAGDSELVASHIPPAIVKSTRLDSRGLVSDRRSDAVVERATARVLTRSPVRQRSAPGQDGTVQAATRDKPPNKPLREPPAAQPQVRSERSS